MSPAFREVPADFLAMAATMRSEGLARHYSTGPATIKRWKAETGAGDGPPRRSREKEAPAADFAALAGSMSIDESKRHWKRGEETLRRWETLTGVRMKRDDRLRPMPDDFVEKHATMAIPALAKHYRACKTVIGRWAAEAGVTRKLGARLTRRTPKPFVRVEPEKPKAPVVLKAKFAPVDRLRRDASRAGQAADYLRRFGPVARCDAKGRYAENGTHWRRGSNVLTADEVIERAERNGWQPDAWRLVA
jgi:hypothetical protein